MERSQLEIKPHAHTNTRAHAEEKGLKNANSDTQSRAVNPVLIVNSARWLHCAAVSPFILLSCHPSWLWHWAGTYSELPQEPDAHSNTQGLFAYTSTDSVEIQRPIMAWCNSLWGHYYKLYAQILLYFGGWVCARVAVYPSIKISVCESMWLWTWASHEYDVTPSLGDLSCVIKPLWDSKLQPVAQMEVIFPFNFQWHVDVCFTSFFVENNSGFNVWIVTVVVK